MPITFQRSSKLISTPPIAYKYYKWHITENKGPDSILIQVSEFKFTLDGIDTDMSNVTLSLLDNHTSPSGEQVINLKDGSLYNKFLDLDFASGGTNVLFEFANALPFNGYRWATANDDPQRDPKSWTLYGSNDNSNWTLLNTVNGFISTDTRWTYNSAFTFQNGVDVSGIESKVTFTANYVAPINDGTTPQRAGQSAYQIKTDFPSSTDGLYWIKNDNINGGTPFQIYADMTTEGGGWTLIMLNNYTNWNQSNAILRNETTPPTSPNDRPRQGEGADGSENYSIIGWADYLKSSPSGFQYMFDANTRNHYGGIWQANENYSFTGSVDVAQYNGTGPGYFGTDVVAGTDGFRQNITEIQKFPTNTGTWDYNDAGLERRMPWYSNNSALYIPNAVITTTHDDGNSWWGTLIADAGFSPAPWQNDVGMGYPGIIWYWVR